MRKELTNTSVTNAVLRSRVRDFEDSLDCQLDSNGITNDFREDIRFWRICAWESLRLEYDFLTWQLLNVEIRSIVTI